MTATYIISQIFVILAYIFLGIGFGKKEHSKILFYSTIYCFLNTIHYILLSGLLGALANIVSIIRNIIFYNNDKKSKKNLKLILYLFCIISIIYTIILYKNPFDIFPCILTLIGTYSYWNTNTKVTRIGCILVSICYIVYAIPIQSYFTIVLEVFLIIKTLLGYFKYEKNKNEIGAQ